ncbi:Galactose-3-O-sulfotransferase [Branchiostoma belcheri]|nr:Galactose-3-O-sulfotransferase [Branchiostoma belcheri]
MDKRKMLILQTVAVLLIIVAFMLLVYEFPRYHARQGPVNGQTNGQDAQGAAVNRAGSTTLQCMLMRYAYNHHLHVILPKTGLDLKWSDKDSARSFEDLPWADDVYNVIAHGMTYKWRVHDVMPRDTAYFSVLRNPENHFKSMFHYYDVGKVMGISGKNQASKLLKNPAALTSKKGGVSETQFVTSVRMSAQARDLGFGPGTDFDEGKSLENFRNITRDFGMLVILEHLSESLVLLRRVMCWKLQDILYLEKSVTQYRLQDILYLEKSVTQYSYKDTPMGPKQLANLRKINKIDFQLYDFFNQTLWKTIKGLGPEFLDEVKYYREVNIEVDKFCRQIETEATISKLSIPDGKWTKGFLVSQRTCEELKLEFEDWHNKFVMRRNAEIRKKESESGDEGTNEKVGKKSEQSTADILKELNAPDELPPPPGQLSSLPKKLPPPPVQLPLSSKQLPPSPGQLPPEPKNLPPVPLAGLPPAKLPPPPSEQLSPAKLPPPPKELPPSSQQLPPPPPQ